MEVSHSRKSGCTSTWCDCACERMLIASFMLSMSPLLAASFSEPAPSSCSSAFCMHTQCSHAPGAPAAKLVRML